MPARRMPKSINDLAATATGEPGLRAWLDGAAALLAAGLCGFGLILAVAANWQDLGRFGQFGLLAAVALAAFAGAAWRASLRVPGSVVAFAAVGGLLALLGQTYQSGADPWQLFAAWAALGLPLALAARHDAVWVPWVVVAFTAISLWMLAETGRYAAPAAGVVFSGWLAAFAIVAALAPTFELSAWTGHSVWAYRLAAVLALIMVTIAGSTAIFTGPLSVALGALILTGGAAFWLAQRRPIELPLLVAVTIGLDVLIITAVAWVTFARADILAFLLTGLAASGVVAGSASVLLKMAAHGAGPRPESADDAPGAPIQDGVSVNWPVAVLSGVGALLAAAPLLAFGVLALGGMLTEGAAPYILGLVLLAGSVAALRTVEPLGFRQQICSIALAVGGLLLGFGLLHDLGGAVGGFALLLIAMAVNLMLPPSWLSALHGVAGGAFFALAAASTVGKAHDIAGFLLAWCLAGAVGAVAMLAMPRLMPATGTGTERHEAWSRFVAGWLVASLLGLLLASGPTFLVGATWQPAATRLGTATGDGLLWALSRGLSFACAIAAAVLLFTDRAVPRTYPVLAIAAAFLVLSLFSPVLGVALLILAAALVHGRAAIAVLAAIVMIWALGSFYYALAWPLMTKAALLAGLGVLLAAVCWMAGVRSAPGLPRLAALAAGDGAGRAPAPAALIGLAMLAAVGVVGGLIWQKERLIRTGDRVYLALEPVDPRSLIQGDYMALRFALPATAGAEKLLGSRASRPSAIATVDSRGVASVVEVSTARMAQESGRIAIGLTFKNGRWTIGPDAWFFKEGEGRKFARARFGEFRIGRNGESILVGMADETLAPIR